MPKKIARRRRARTSAYAASAKSSVPAYVEPSHAREIDAGYYATSTPAAPSISGSISAPIMCTTRAKLVAGGAKKFAR